MSGQESASLTRIADDLHNFVEYSRPTRRGQLSPVFTTALGTVPVLVAVIALFLQVGPVKDLVDKQVSTHTKNDENLALTSKQLGTPKASSYVQDVSDASVFWPLNVLDDDKTTGWAECSHGDKAYANASRATRCSADGGSGEWIEIPLTAAVTVKLVRIRNGYQKRNELFLRNPRVKDMKITFWSKAGTRNQAVLLRDEPGYQTIDVHQAGITRIRFTIVSVYPGEKFLGRSSFGDTTISDIQIVPTQRLE